MIKKTGFSRPIILAIDDEKDILELYRIHIEAEGKLHVVTAADLPAAEKEMQKHNVVLALVDVHLGRTSGFGAVRRLRQLRPNLPVLICTGEVEIEKIKEAAVASGAYAVLRKPFHYKSIMRSVKQGLQLHRKI